MPALPDVANVLRLDHFFQLGEDLKAKVRQYYGYLGAPLTNAEATAVAGLVRAAFSADMAGLMFNAYHLVDTVITDLTSPTAGVGSDTTSVPGTRAGPALSADVCLLQSDEIGRRYRGGHPRQYWPFGVSADLADVQTWLPAFITAAATDITEYMADTEEAINTVRSGAEQVAVSYYRGFTVHTGTTGRARNVSTPRPAAVVDVVTSNIFRTGLAVQRRRLLRLA